MGDGKTDIWPCIGGKVKEHADDGTVVPFFFHRWSIRVTAKAHLGGWHKVAIAICHACGLNDLLNEPWLGHCNCSIFPSEMDAQVLSKITVHGELESSSLESFHKFVDCVHRWSNNTTIIHPEKHHHVFLEEDTFVEFALGEAIVEQGLSETLVPQPRCNRESIKALVESETGFGGLGGGETTRNMDPNRIFQLGLNEGIVEIDADHCPIASQGKYQGDTNRGPVDDG